MVRRRVVVGLLAAAAWSRRELAGALVRAALSRPARRDELAFARAIVVADRSTLVLGVRELQLLYREAVVAVDRVVHG